MKRYVKKHNAQWHDMKIRYSGAQETLVVQHVKMFKK